MARTYTGSLPADGMLFKRHRSGDGSLWRALKSVITPEPLESGPDRIDWVDTARGLAIVLVVLFHCGLAAKHIGSGHLSADYVAITSVVDDLRMPLFFFCSGILAYWGLRKPWSVVLEKRVKVLLWVILVWTLIYFVFQRVAPVLPWGGGRHALDKLYIVPLGTLWFMYAITCLSIFMRAIQPMQIVRQFAIVCFVNAAAILAFKVISWGGYTLFMSNLASYAIFCFAGGIWLAPVATKLLSNQRNVPLFFVTSLAVFSLDLALSFGWPFYASLPKIVQCVPKIVFAINFAALIALWQPARALLAWLGGRTLEIFLFHTVVIGLMVNFLRPWPLSENEALLLLFPVALTGSILCERSAASLKLRFLFRPPGKLSVG